MKRRRSMFGRRKSLGLVRRRRPMVRRRSRRVGQVNTRDKYGLKELGNVGMTVAGMVAANFAASLINYGFSYVGIGKENPKMKNVLTSVAGLGLTWALPKFGKNIPVLGTVAKFMDKPYVKPIAKGATYMFGFSLALNGLNMIPGLNKIPGFGGEGSLFNQISGSIAELGGGTVSGIWGSGDYNAKLTFFTEELDKIKTEYAALPTPNNAVKRDLQTYAENEIGFCDVLLNQAKKDIEEGNFQKANLNLEEAKEKVLILKGFLCSYGSLEDKAAISPEALPELEAELEEAPLSEPVVDTEDGMVALEEGELAPAPEIEETVVETAEGQVGRAFNVNFIEQWAKDVASVMGWTDARVLASFLLRYIAERQHVYAFGQQPIQAAEGATLSGVNDRLNRPAFFNWNNETYEVNTISGVMDMVRSVKGYV